MRTTAFTAIETAQLEDSLQRLSTMSESDRYAFAEQLITKMKADEARQKQLDAARLLELQSQTKPDPNASGSKWYWNNEKAKKEGFEEFKRQWGQRSNEDDWRRSEKISFAEATNAVDDTLGPDNATNSASS